ncbi:MAG: pyridoxal phosphate-dependent aminotransferase [Thermoplasmata archaeon]
MAPTYKIADRVKGVSESVIRKMTRKAERYDAVNLSQGYPGYRPPQKVLEAAKNALFQNSNQYSITWGLQELREEVSRHWHRKRGVNWDPDCEVTITCGTSEAIISTILGLVDPGDEVLVFQPFYENYIPAIEFAGGIPVYSRINRELNMDREDLKSKITKKTKLMMLNTPHNPSGKVFGKDEIKFILQLCQEYDVLLVCDEIYEDIVYQGKHVSPASIEGARERTIVVSGISKTYSLTGWRVGFAASDEEMMKAVRKVHDYNTVCAPTPFQIGAVQALRTESKYYKDMLEYYRTSRDYMYESLENLGFKTILPDGAYYMMTGIDEFGMGDLEFADYLVENVGVAVVPGTSFYQQGGENMVRFSFSPNMDELKESISRMKEGL